MVSKLQGGADLMLPGVVLTKEENPLTAVQEGQLCSVNVIGNRYMQNRGFLKESVELCVYKYILYGMRSGWKYQRVHEQG